MGFFMEDLESILKTAEYTKLNFTPPVFMEGDFNRLDIDQDGFYLIDEDIATQEGTDAYSEVIYSYQTCTLEAYVTSRENREKMRDDIKEILETNKIQITSILPVNYLEKHGLEFKLRRIVDGL